MWQTLKEDIQVVFERDPAARSTWEVVIAYPGFHAILVHRLAHWLWQRQWLTTGALRQPRRPVSHRHRDPSGSEDRPALFHRSRHGRGDRRDRRDRRRRDDLSGRDPRRHFDGAHQAPSDHRRFGDDLQRRGGARSGDGRPAQPDRRRLGAGELGAAAFHGRRHPRSSGAKSKRAIRPPAKRSSTSTPPICPIPSPRRSARWPTMSRSSKRKSTS